MEKKKEIYCKCCNQKLMEAEYVKAEIKCPRCGKIIKVEYPTKVA